MKKLLLLSAMATGVMFANAQSFNDYFKVTYEGAEITSGQMIASEKTDAEGSMYKCDYLITPLQDASLSSISYIGVYTGEPSYEESQADLAAWGHPSICYEFINGQANCIPGTGNIISEYTFPSMSGALEMQFHLEGPIDMSTFTFKLPEKVGIYRIVLTGAYDGEELEGEFITDIKIGPGATGINSIVEDSNAPVVYYDLMGRKLLNPEKGEITIVRQGSKVKKVIF